MRLPETYFQNTSKRDLLTDNSLYRSLDYLEKYRGDFDNEKDFATSRFSVLVNFVKTKKPFSKNELEQDLFNFHSKKNEFEIYEDLRQNLYHIKDKVVLDHFFYGSSTNQVLLEENLSFEDYLLSLRKIEARIRETLRPILKHKAFGFFTTKAAHKLSEERRQVMSLLASGYVNSEIADITSKQRTSVSNDITNSLKIIGLDRQSYENELERLKTLNLPSKEKLYFNNLFNVLSEQQKSELLDFCGDLDKAAKFANRFLIHLSSLQRKVFIRRMWSFSQKQTSVSLDLDGKTVDSAFGDAKKKLRLMVKAFFREKGSIPRGLDPVRFLLLTPHQSMAIRHYIDGKSKDEIQALFKVSSRTSVDDYFRDARRKLRVSQRFLDELQKEKFLTKLDLVKHQITLVFPSFKDSYDQQNPETITYLKAEINAVLDAIESSNSKLTTKYFNEHVTGLSVSEIAEKHNVDPNTVRRSINRVIEKIRESHSSSNKHTVPKGVDYKLWRLLEPNNQAIYQEHLKGKSKAEIVRDLNLEIEVNSLYPRIVRIQQRLGLEKISARQLDS